MISFLFEVLIRNLWNAVRNGIFRHRGPAQNDRTEKVSDSVSLGKILRSPFAPPPLPDAPTELYLSTEDKRRHLYLLGSTGSGKTNLLLQLVRTDISQGRGVCLLDARGELVDRVLLMLASEYTPEELEDRLLLIDMRHTDYSVPINPLQEAAVDAYTRVRFIIEVLQKEWEIGVQTEQLLRNSLLALALSGGEYSLYELEPFLTVASFRARVLANVTDAGVRRFFARFNQMSNQSAWVEPVLNKVSPWLSRPVLKHVLAQKQSVSFHKLLDERPDRIILVSLSANTLFGDAHLLGSLMTHSIVAAAMRPERRDKKGNELCFYLDEFEHFEGLSEQFGNILAEGRKFGLCLCLSHQTTVQLNPKLRSLIRNVVGTQIFFSVGGGEADTLSGEIASDEPKAVIRNLIMNQQVGQCVVVQRGKSFTRLKTRLLSDPQVSEQKVNALCLSALKRWGRPGSEIAAELAAREREYANAHSSPPSPATAPEEAAKPELPTGTRKKRTIVAPPDTTPAPTMEVEVRDASDTPVPKKTRRRK